MYYGFVYETTNNITGHKYIGKHKRSQDPNDPDDSWYLGSGKLLMYAIEKYGLESFTRVILDECTSEEDLQLREKYRIKEVDAVNNPEYYNLVEDANPPRNDWTFGDSVKNKLRVYKDCVHKYISKEDLTKYLLDGWREGWSQSSRDKMSESRKEFLKDPTNHPMYGKHHTEESKKKMGTPRFGEDNPMYGKHHTEEYKKTRSALYSGRVWVCNTSLNLQRQIDPEDLPKYESKGYVRGTLPRSEEYKSKIREAMKSVVYSHTCRLCGNSFKSRSSGSRYCESCKLERGW